MQSYYDFELSSGSDLKSDPDTNISDMDSNLRSSIGTNSSRSDMCLEEQQFLGFEVKSDDEEYLKECIEIKESQFLDDDNDDYKSGNLDRPASVADYTIEKSNTWSPEEIDLMLGELLEEDEFKTEINNAVHDTINDTIKDSLQLPPIYTKNVNDTRQKLSEPNRA